MASGQRAAWVPPCGCPSTRLSTSASTPPSVHPLTEKAEPQSGPGSWSDRSPVSTASLVPEATMDWCEWECEPTEGLACSDEGLPPDDSGERALTTVRLRGP